MKKKPLKKRPPKTKKEKAWAKKVAETGDPNLAAELVYDVTKKSSARAIASQNLQKLSIGDALTRHDVSSDYVASKIKQGMEATKVISATIIAGNPKEAGSETKDFIEVPDWQAQHRFTETALRLMGYGQQYQIVANVDNRKVYVVLPPEIKSDTN